MLSSPVKKSQFREIVPNMPRSKLPSLPETRGHLIFGRHGNLPFHIRPEGCHADPCSRNGRPIRIARTTIKISTLRKNPTFIIFPPDSPTPLQST
jgi:hypothetical protein